MRLPVTLALLFAVVGSGAFAQPTGAGSAAPAAPPAPPKVFQAAGYSEPEINAGLCKAIDAQHTQCVIPEMTAGRYRIEVSGTSTATADDAAQQIGIFAGDTGCQLATRRGTNQNPWKVGQAQTFHYNCTVTVITDRALTVTAVYADFHATKDPKGPTLAVRALPWSGVLSAVGAAPPQ